MLASRMWFIGLALLSSSAFAAVSFEEKQERVENLMKIQDKVPALAFEAYQRELQYEQQGLSVKARARMEVNLLADKIRNQIHLAYKAELEKLKSEDLAREEVRAAIEKDLTLAAPELKDELKDLSMQTLDAIENGGISEEVDLSNMEAVFEKEVVNRKTFLNQEGYTSDPVKPSANGSKDSEKKEYASRQELMASLVSDRESSRWVSTSNQTIKTGEVTKTESKISLQVKLSFLGVAVEGGPMITFKREHSTNAAIMAEGLNPVLYNDGNFDFWKRDAAGKIVVKNGKEQKRYIAFFCDAELNFATEYAGGGGFSFMGVGGNVTVSKSFSNSVNLQSRRIALPEYVAGKSMTVKYISELCHRDFLNARFSNTLTVAKSLDIMMKNVVSGLTFSHPKTKCATDNHCYNWFNNEVISLVKNKNFPRCVEENREKFYSCQLRGLEGQNCPVYEKGKRTSDGQWEYACDKGLKCVKYENQTFFLGAVWSYAKGKCQVINKKTYKDPFKEAWDNTEIEVEIQN